MEFLTSILSKFGFIWGIFSSGWFWTILGFIAAAFLRFSRKKYMKFAKEVVDVGKKYSQVTDPKSPGGEKMTSEEKNEFIKEVGEAIQEATIFLPAKWTK